jgi:hypothetical protein
MWQRSYDDMACLYAEGVVDDLVIVDWQMWTNLVVTHGIILTNGMVPRGTLLLVWLFKIL